MIAAAPASHSDSLDLIRLAFSIKEQAGSTIPEQLKQYVTAVLAQAKAIVHEPARITNDTMPEAIELASEMSSLQELSGYIESIADVDGIEPDLAKKLLDALEVHPVYQNGFGPIEGLSY